MYEIHVMRHARFIIIVSGCHGDSTTLSHGRVRHALVTRPIQIPPAENYLERSRWYDSAYLIKLGLYATPILHHVCSVRVVGQQIWESCFFKNCYSQKFRPLKSTLVLYGIWLCWNMIKNSSKWHQIDFLWVCLAGHETNWKTTNLVRKR